MKRLVIATLLSFILLSNNFALASESRNKFREETARGIINGLRVMSRTKSGLPISHYNHPSYNELSFLYDSVVVAMTLFYGGQKAKAVKIMDYYHDIIQEAKLNIDTQMDFTGIYGAAKKLTFNGKSHIGIVNSLDVDTENIPGAARLEFHVTPGPTSFVIFAFMHINKEKYLDSAIELGELLLAMQNDAGGVLDGDRSRYRIHTEPHVDSYAAFNLLHNATGEKRWEQAAVKARQWVLDNVYDPRENIIWQGVWDDRLNTVLAEDAFSWAILSGVLDVLSDEQIYQLNMKLLELFLVKIKLKLPGTDMKELYLVDFTDPLLPETIAVRKGVHPLGTVEWTAGAVMALQKSSVRLFNKGMVERARKLKAIAEILLDNCFDSFYGLPRISGSLTFYSTGQGVEVGPFGAIKESGKEGWMTPYFYVRGEQKIAGGCTIGAWALLPYWGINPFVLDDDYKTVYDSIVVDGTLFDDASSFMNELVLGKSFTESIPVKATGNHVIIVEPRDYNKKMWDAYNKAERTSKPEESEKYFNEMQYWALKIIDEKDWVKLSIEQNIGKKEKFGGLVPYMWGKVSENNKSEEHHKILSYPVLNEMGTAYWALMVSAYELGDMNKLVEYFKQMCEVALLHQIPDVIISSDDQESIQGYWNAISQFCKPIYPTHRDLAIHNYLKQKFGHQYLKDISEKLTSNK